MQGDEPQGDAVVKRSAKTGNKPPSSKKAPLPMSPPSAQLSAMAQWQKSLKERGPDANGDDGKGDKGNELIADLTTVTQQQGSSKVKDEDKPLEEASAADKADADEKPAADESDSALDEDAEVDEIDEGEDDSPYDDREDDDRVSGE